MGRIRKKLYLSAKVTESMRDIHTSTSSAGLSGEPEESMPTLSTGQLMSLVRSGSRAIARPEIDPTEMLKWSWEETVVQCRDYQDKLESLDKDKDAGESQAEEERRWLSEMERVETRVFEGKKHEKSSGPESNSVIAAEWSREQRRVGMERVTMVDGHPVLKETIGNNEWEAVKTFAGKNIPGLAEPAKRKRKQIEHQDYCQICFDGGTLHTCSGCPRTYHVQCLPEEFKPKLKAKGGHFYCPQHQCVDCEQKTVSAHPSFVFFLSPFLIRRRLTQVVCSTAAVGVKWPTARTAWTGKSPSFLEKPSQSSSCWILAQSSRPSGSSARAASHDTMKTLSR